MTRHEEVLSESEQFRQANAQIVAENEAIFGEGPKARIVALGHRETGDRAAFGRRVITAACLRDGRAATEGQLCEELGLSLPDTRLGMWWARKWNLILFPDGDLGRVQLTGKSQSAKGATAPSRGLDRDGLAALSLQLDEDEEPELPPHLVRVCWCGECGLAFTGVGAFDAHRAGDYDRPGTTGTSTRRCLNMVELAEKGYRPNDQGRWGRPGVEATS